MDLPKTLIVGICFIKLKSELDLKFLTFHELPFASFSGAFIFSFEILANDSRTLK